MPARDASIDSMFLLCSHTPGQHAVASDTEDIMGHRRIRTVGDLSRLGTLVRAECLACGHVARVNAIELILVIHSSTRVERIPFRCSRCGSRDVRSSADFDSLMARGGDGKAPQG